MKKDCLSDFLAGDYPIGSILKLNEDGTPVPIPPPGALIMREVVLVKDERKDIIGWRAL